MELRPNKNSLDVGYLLHWYEIKKVIGRGGFGITYLAHDTNLDRDVAIKEFMPEEFASRESDSTVHPKTGDQEKLYNWGLERFIAEARTLAKFNHPNIVRVQSVFEENNTAYMVMEYAQGKDLSKVFKTEDKFSEERLLDMFIPILDGLSLVHNAGFIHRDIKPANIYICDNNSPILLDFGSARQSIGGKTQALTSLVTFGYAPYEQYNEGSGKQGPWTDIYSLGASLYFGITGKKPIDALFRGGGFLEKGIDPYEPVSVLAEGEYPETFLLAIDNALMFKIEERPRNILNWADMLLGKKLAPQLPDYMLTTLEPDDHTELSWSDTELGYSTEVSRNSQSGTQGLVDAHGKRTTDYTQATVVRHVNSLAAEQARVNTEPNSNDKSATIKSAAIKSATVKKVDSSLSTIKRFQFLIVIAGVAVILLAVTLSWIFRAPTAPEISDKIQSKKSPQSHPEKSDAIQKNNKLEVLIVKAKSAVAAKKYVEPRNNNAVYFYRQILKLDVNNVFAKNGLLKIEEYLSNLANATFEKQQYKNAQKYTSQLLWVNNNSLDAKMLQQQIDAKQLRDKQVSAWLVEAEVHIKNKRYTNPKNKNAFDVYYKVLQQQSDNQQAVDGVQYIKNYYVTEFDKHIKAFKLTEAEYDIEALKKISAPVSTINQMQSRLTKQQKIKSNKVVKVKTKPKPKSKPEKIKTKKLDINQASQLIGKFKMAMQARNTKKIKHMSQLVPGRAQFIEQLHKQYRNINVKVSNLQVIAKENSAHANIELNKLIDINGNKVTPGSWSKFEIKLRYNNRNQLKVYW